MKRDIGRKNKEDMNMKIIKYSAIAVAILTLIVFGALIYSKKLNDTIKESFEDLLFDPQTSGGLLVSLKKKDAKEVLKRLQEQEQTRYSKIVGEVEEKQEAHLIFL